MKTFTNYLMICLCAYFMSNCNDKNNNTVLLRSIIDEYTGTELHLPDSLRMYKPFFNYISDSSEMSNSKFKIYSLIDGSCSTCIFNINNWNLLIPELIKHNVPVFLIIRSDDGFEQIRYFCETGEIECFPYPFFFDKYDDFFRKNEFMAENKHFETVLTDRENRIILFGNPLFNIDIKELYFDRIVND